MPIGRSSTAAPRLRTSDPRTGLFHSDSSTRPPPYRPTPARPARPSLALTADRDLNYFYTLASGAYLPGELLIPGATLALHLFRGTDTHLFPVAERLNLGTAAGAPYYTARAMPDATIAHEYNTLVVSRRHPLRFVAEDVCVAEIRPRLDLFSPGICQIGTLARRVGGGPGEPSEEQYTMSWLNTSKGPLRDCWCLWKGTEAVVQFYADGFRGLDQDPGRGFIRAKLPNNLNAGGIGLPNFQDPRTIASDLAYLDFETEYPLLISADRRAHAIMDVLVSALFVVLTVVTRKAAIIRRHEEAVWQDGGPPPTYSM
ncbi:hypothetical protein NKR23_g8698 [Pleurostoma richardsiae]|uniref:Uncharacterized protein n=1 Tax=Pleurostoma richardsiae TaxID=41990 RepID=A0AA38RHW2_9PEZI|nr:hypothetical protein NKR23_g8698 [Pleurostoma richardsiae]